MEEKPTSKLTAYICVAFCAAIAAVCLFMSFGHFQDHRRYPGEGQTAQAYPTSNKYTETRRRFGIKSYDTDLAFKTANGQTIHLPNHNISKAELAILQQGQTIAREYLPEDPAGTARRPGDLFGLWVTLAISLVALLFAWGYWPSNQETDTAGEAGQNEQD